MYSLQREERRGGGKKKLICTVNVMKIIDSVKRLNCLISKRKMFGIGVQSEGPLCCKHLAVSHYWLVSKLLQTDICAASYFQLIIG